MGKLLIFVGLSIALTGLFVVFGTKLGIGNLPGDLTFKTDRVLVKIPLMTCVLISAVISMLIWIYRFFFPD
jgi:hypothetical protein